MEKISVKTNSRIEIVEITEKIQAAVAKNKIKSGVCFIFAPHTTAGLTINENVDPSVREDMIKILSKLIPKDGNYAHSEGNSDSHTKSSLFGSSLTVFVEDGRLALGTWQGIQFCESDGPRSREVWIKF